MFAGVTNNMKDGSVLLKSPSKPRQCDSDPACENYKNDKGLS